MKKQMLAGMATAMTALALAACGNTSTTKESASHQPYEAATTKIKEGHYQEALKTLNDADSSSQKSQVLASDLQNYLAAKTAYNKGNYDQALTSLSTSKSGNESMQTAYQKKFGSRLRKRRVMIKLPPNQLVTKVVVKQQVLQVARKRTVLARNQVLPRVVRQANQLQRPIQVHPVPRLMFQPQRQRVNQ